MKKILSLIFYHFSLYFQLLVVEKKKKLLKKEEKLKKKQELLKLLQNLLMMNKLLNHQLKLLKLSMQEVMEAQNYNYSQVELYLQVKNGMEQLQMVQIGYQLMELTSQETIFPDYNAVTGPMLYQSFDEYLRMVRIFHQF